MDFNRVGQHHLFTVREDQSTYVEEFVADTFVAPFSKAMASLKKGGLTAEPIQTQFGWHVIRLDDIRETAPPPLTEVRTQIVEGLQRQKLSNFQQSLRSKASIK